MRRPFFRGIDISATSVNSPYAATAVKRSPTHTANVEATTDTRYPVNAAGLRTA